MQATLAGVRKWGSRNAGVVISDPPLATPGNVKVPAGPHCGAGLPGDGGAGRAALARRIAILGTTAAGSRRASFSRYRHFPCRRTSAPTFLKLDPACAFPIGLAFFVDPCDNTVILVGVTHRAGRIDDTSRGLRPRLHHRQPRH